MSRFRIHAFPVPLHAMLAAALLWSAILVGEILLLHTQPWLGITLVAEPDQDGLRVTGVPKRGPLTRGDVIRTLSAADMQAEPLDTDSLLQEPDNYSTFAGFNGVFEHNERLFAILSESVVTATLADGRQVSLHPTTRPLRTFPLDFWIINFAALVAILFGTAIWRHRPQQDITRLLALTGLLFLLGVCATAVYSSRVLALDPVWFQLTTRINHIAISLFVVLLPVMFWHYPRRISHFSAFSSAVLIALLYSINEWLQLIQPPYHAFYLLNLFTYPLVLGVAWYQWRLNRDHPVNRAAMRWFLLSVCFATSAVVLLYFLPPFFDEEPLVSLGIAHLLFLTLYIGIALGVARYRLFDVERWWFKSWIWFLAGLLIIGIDIALVYLLNIHPAGALSIAVIVVAWLYFPLRQRLWERVFHLPDTRLEAHLPGLMESYFSAGSAREFGSRWQSTLAETFQPLQVNQREGFIEQSRIAHHGQTLCVRALDDDAYIELSGRNRGSRLFSNADLELSEAIRQLARHARDSRRAQEKGAQLERRRIMRDLHDDVGAKLLTLVCKASSPLDAELAKESLQLLRETIRTMDDSVVSTLPAVLGECRREALDRVEAAGAVLEWEIDGAPVVSITSRQHINLTRILREAITNALKHGQPEKIEVVFPSWSPSLCLRVRNSGVADNLEPQPGVGLLTMQARANEVGGSVQWRLEQSTFTVEVEIPLTWKPH